MKLVSTGLKSKQIQTDRLNELYARDAGSEFAAWYLLYGSAAAQLTQDGQELTATVTLNGVETDIVIKLNGAPAGTSTVAGAEDNRVRLSMTVECDQDGDIYDDDCLALPGEDDDDDMVARYTIFLEQISPDISAGITALYDELPKEFELIPGSVTSPDGSLIAIESVTPTNIGSEDREIWKWDFSASPIQFQQGEIKQFTFEATIEDDDGRYCNGVFAKMESLPNGKSARTCHGVVGTDPPDGCHGGGAHLIKYADRNLALPNVNTVVTYIFSVENIEKNTLHVEDIKDVLLPDGFKYCSPSFPPDDPLLSCDPPIMWKIADEPFDPVSGDFTDISGFTVYPDPQQTFLTADDRWELFWDGPGGAGWQLKKAGNPGDNLIMRFQAHVTPGVSGTYYNEAFANVDCSAPSSLIADAVTSKSEYCASYSWPTGGVVVPAYEVSSASGGLTAQGIVVITGDGTSQLTSWHVN